MRRNRNKTRQNPADNPILNATIESLDQEGRGVAHVNGKTIFIDGALPGEQVTYQAQRIKPSYEVANTIEVLTKSNQRVTPKCPHYGLCGGCKLQHMDATAQVLAKQQMLEADLQHIGKVKAEKLLPPLFGPTWGYRHKARLSVKYVQKKERVLVGFNEKGTRFVADMNSCEVLTPEVSALIAPLQDMIIQLTIKDKLPQIELAVGEADLKNGREVVENKPVIVLILRIMDVLTASDETLLKATDFSVFRGDEFQQPARLTLLLSESGREHFGAPEVMAAKELVVILNGRAIARTRPAEWTESSMVIELTGLSSSDVNEIFARLTQ